MKIGIITFWDTEENYGQVLQCYAMVKYLKILGHNAFLIKTKDTSGSKRTVKQKLYTLLYMISHPGSFYSELRKKSSQNGIPEGIVVKRNFSFFREQYLPSSEKIYTYEDLAQQPLDCDVIICGSDQIWSSISPLMYLQFPGNFKRISYAASFGGFQIKNRIDRKQVKSWLDTFDFVSVREKAGVAICNELGVKAELFPDPTLLLDKEDYESVSDKNCQNQNPYILIYMLGNRTEFDLGNVYNLACENHLDVKYVASQGRVDEFEKIYPTIPEWLSLIKNARAVITNSFHGTVFSLIFNTPFLTVPLSGTVTRMNGRISDLLTRCHLEKRIFSGDLNAIFDEIDFSSFNSIKEKDVMRVSDVMKTILCS